MQYLGRADMKVLVKLTLICVEFDKNKDMLSLGMASEKLEESSKSEVKQNTENSIGCKWSLPFAF